MSFLKFAMEYGGISKNTPSPYSKSWQLFSSNVTIPFSLCEYRFLIEYLENAKSLRLGRKLPPVVDNWLYLVISESEVALITRFVVGSVITHLKTNQCHCDWNIKWRIDLGLILKSSLSSESHHWVIAGNRCSTRLPTFYFQLTT